MHQSPDDSSGQGTYQLSAKSADKSVQICVKRESIKKTRIVSSLPYSPRFLFHKQKVTLERGDPIAGYTLRVLILNQQ